MSDLREAIAKYLWADGKTDDSVNTDKLWDGLPDRFKVGWRDDAENLLALLREHGLVELDKDQSFAPFVGIPVGFRRVHELGSGELIIIDKSGGNTKSC